MEVVREETYNHEHDELRETQHMCVSRREHVREAQSEETAE